MTPEHREHLEALLAACQSKEPLKVADAFQDLILDKTADLVNQERDQLARTLFATPTETPTEPQ